jgi:Tol biopolymer transport system component
MPHAKALSGSLLLVLIACGGTEPPDNATADIKADGADGPVTVTANVAVNLSWSSENATSCLVTPGGLSGTTGSATVEDLTATTTYRLSCTGPGGEAEDSVHIVVTSPPGTQIVFQSSDGSISDIYVVNADGSGLTRLTDYADADLAPSWSGDGRQIYFLSSNRDGRGTLDLYAMNAGGTDVHLVVANIYSSGGLSQAYAVSPDGTRIALGAITPLQSPQNVDLFVMNADGSERTRIVDLPCEFVDLQCEHIEALAWSPDGQRIAYSSGWQGHGSFHYNNIGVVNADGTGQRALTTFGTRSTEPAWAPDGQRIVFSSSPTNPSYISTPVDLEIINPDGTGRMVLLDGDVDGMANTSPSWSPDGQSIVFARFSPGTDWVVPGQSELFAVNVDGTGLRRVTSVPGGAFAPDCNPAGP